jgi:hypothetical protein
MDSTECNEIKTKADLAVKKSAPILKTHHAFQNGNFDCVEGLSRDRNIRIRFILTRKGRFRHNKMSPSTI